MLRILCKVVGNVLQDEASLSEAWKAASRNKGVNAQVSQALGKVGNQLAMGVHGPVQSQQNHVFAPGQGRTWAVQDLVEQHYFLLFFASSGVPLPL